MCSFHTNSNLIVQCIVHLQSELACANSHLRVLCTIQCTNSAESRANVYILHTNSQLVFIGEKVEMELYSPLNWHAHKLNIWSATAVQTHLGEGLLTPSPLCCRQKTVFAIQVDV